MPFLVCDLLLRAFMPICIFISYNDQGNSCFDARFRLIMRSIDSFSVLSSAIYSFLLTFAPEIRGV